MSENRVYSQTNSHLIGKMISKTIGFRGTRHFQTHPLFPAVSCHSFAWSPRQSFSQENCPTFVLFPALLAGWSRSADTERRGVWDALKGPKFGHLGIYSDGILWGYIMIYLYIYIYIHSFSYVRNHIQFKWQFQKGTNYASIFAILYFQTSPNKWIYIVLMTMNYCLDFKTSR